ncbi:MAG: phosphoribosylaminoimidazolesuccinocarboxamide synthase [Gammaproteobacteria bacterium]|nr:phosphoribosylaminoimidazolesuccinocarboxamide synthase [Gammaproteobacteria bacterium]MCH9743792.1 phosphoribosylaminoimidazolesuccinocarboxamide synthase [Gammaproteobacteria bacterium]
MTAQVVKKDLLYRGKVKSMFRTEDDGLLIAEFHDDTTAFDGVKHEMLDSKGNTNNRISTFLMKKLEAAGIKTHLVDTVSENEVLVKHLKMIPLECVIRNIAAGSLCRRLGVEENLELKPPLFEFFLKNDELHDPLVNDNHAISFGWATEPQLTEMRKLTLKINEILSKLFADAGMILVDAKYEFGVDQAGNICLGDEISPDSCRIWDAKTRETLDKDRFRKDMGKVVESYQIIAERIGA